MLLSKESKSEDGFKVNENNLELLIGQKGEAVTPLRPSGSAMIGNKKISVITNGEFIDSYTEIEVVSIKGMNVIVQKTRQ